MRANGEMRAGGALNVDWLGEDDDRYESQEEIRDKRGCAGGVFGNTLPEKQRDPVCRTDDGAIESERGRAKKEKLETSQPAQHTRGYLENRNGQEHGPDSAR